MVKPLPFLTVNMLSGLSTDVDALIASVCAHPAIAGSNRANINRLFFIS